MQQEKIVEYTALRNTLGISAYNGKSEQYAVLTHYLHNLFSEEAEKYRERIEQQMLLDLESYVYSVRVYNGKGVQHELIRRPFNIKWDIPFAPPINPQFTFIDLFAGIGGMRLAFQNLSGKCVFSSEIDSYAKQTYEANFGEVPHGDITQIETNDIPDHDVLVGGFPCQAFSIAGRRLGFEDTRGTLFYEIARILRDKRPKAFLLENVKGLINHKRGQTLKVILSVLRDELGYKVPDPKIMNAKDFGVPQNRERIFIVGFREDVDANMFSYPQPQPLAVSVADIKEKKTVSAKYYLSTQYWHSMQEHRRRHEEKGNGFGYEIVADEGIANAIVVGGMGRERNLVIDKRLKNFTPVTNIKGEINRKGIRRMTPREWARLQGFPDTFQIVVSDAQAYKQFGNSVAVPAIQATGEKIVNCFIGGKYE